MDFLGLGLGLGGSGIALFILKKIPNEKICAFVEGSFEKLGVLLTAGLSKSVWTKNLWNKTIEPYFIDLIDNVVGGALRVFVKGLRSDNK